MKSKFADVAKVRKRALDHAELALLEARNLERSLTLLLEEVFQELISIQMPQKGGISLLQQVGTTKMILQRQRKDLEGQLASAQQRVGQMQEAYKRANLEFEKIKYLEEQEFEAYLKKLKQKEQSELDEVALQLFASGDKPS